MIRLNRWLLAAGVALGACVAAPAMADIYSFKDEKGVVHFTNIKGLDNRYKLVRKEDGSPDHPGLQRHDARRSCRRRRTSIATPHIIQTAAKAYGVDQSLVHAVISAESGYDRYAVSRAGAMGLMQLMPDTARRYGVQNIMDPAENIHGGVRYLADLHADVQGPHGSRHRRIQRGRERGDPRRAQESRTTPKRATTCRRCSASTRTSRRPQLRRTTEYWAQSPAVRLVAVPDVFLGAPLIRRGVHPLLREPILERLVACARAACRPSARRRA